MFPFDTSRTYFDCTNFYFEIDREDDFRKKGPSKENKKEPIIGMGLLLDARQIPVGMKLFPGNESEKPVIRSIIDDLKRRNNISGKTIQVADKGLNCAENILHALKAGDGYLFSKSVKQLPETEKTWVLLKNGYREVKNKKGKETDGKVKVVMNEEAARKNLELAGYNLLVTSETSMSGSEIYSTYHNLWRIEESFRIMKSQLDARPVYLQKQQTISGHFLICYLTVLLTRLLQIKVLGNSPCSEEMFDFFHGFRSVKISDRKYINLARKSDFIALLAEKTGLPLTSYFLSEAQIKKMLSHRF